MSEDLVNVKGLADLQKFLDQVPAQMEKNIMRGALRAGMNEIKPIAQANIHSVSGELAAGLKVGTKSKPGTVIANLKSTGRHAFLAKWVEFGTAAHFIAAKKGFLFFAGVFTRYVRHPGAKPRPFMRPALDAGATKAVVATGNYIKDRLATKNGLDTSAVLIEGDE